MTATDGHFSRRIGAFYHRHQALLLFLLAVLVNLLGFLYVCGTRTCHFAQNDDYRMRDLASGAYLGEPTPYLVFMKYPVGLLLSGLYTYFPSVSWYGLFLYACILLPCIVTLYRASRQCASVKQLGVVYLVYLLAFWVIIQRHIAAPQFTTSAAFLAAGAAALLLTMPRTPKRPGWFAAELLLFALLCFGSVCVREKTFLMFVPLLLLILFVRQLGCGRLWKRTLSLTLSLVLVYGGVMWLEQAVQTDESRAYQEFNTARSQVYDYYDIPIWTGHEEFYESIGLDKTLAQSIRSRYYELDERVTTETLTQLADYMREIERETPFIRRVCNAVSDTFESFVNSNILLPQSMLLLTLLFALLLAALAGRRHEPIILICGGVLLLLFEVCFLLFQGRMVSRIPESMLVVLASMTLCMLPASLGRLRALVSAAKTQAEGFATMKRSRLTRVCSILTAGICSAALLLTLTAGAYQAYQKSAASYQSRGELLLETRAFCRKNPDNFYYLDADDFITLTEPVFDDDETRYKNMESAGSWLLRSPQYRQKIRARGFETMTQGLVENGNVYYLATTRPTVLIKYISQRYEGHELLKAGSIAGGKVMVYKVYQTQV
ncbi:hypothetical protein [Candidatus Soleaferrea massiliensis]|uniref:hypothetical protein n=1 Tax=Candidatus Soleaferrea massiliensis TaxID=1470354 RepID=UPI00058E51F4|nr:hypothetical protein [Candidatus Soleaferrea massiliensis]